MFLKSNAPEQGPIKKDGALLRVQVKKGLTTTAKQACGSRGIAGLASPVGTLFRQPPDPAGQHGIGGLSGQRPDIRTFSSNFDFMVFAVVPDNQ